MMNISVKPDKTRLQNLLEEISMGSVKIPVFQRDFVWKPNQMIELFDSILKGYPIGSLLFWYPEDRFHTKDYIGPYKVSHHSENVNYVLDGFQRISTLFGVLLNPKKNEFAKSLDLKDYRIYYDLYEKEFTYLRKGSNFSAHFIPLFKAFDTFEFLDFMREIERNFESIESKKLIDNAKELSKILYDYEIPFIQIKGGDIKSAVQIFSRINSKGTEISQDFMLSALSYNVETNFLFSEAISEFLNSLNIFNFEKLKRDTILNCIANSKGKVYFDVKIEELLKPDLEQLSSKAFVYIRSAVSFLYNDLRVLDVRLLPYPTQLIFISEFFRINPILSDEQVSALKTWFWFTTYSNYFTIYSLSQQRLSYQIFIDFARGVNPDGILRYNEDEKFPVARFPEKLNFTGVRTKALQLFMINHQKNHDDIGTGEFIKELFIFNKKDRTPANIIIFTSEDYNSNFLDQDIDSFINNTNPSILSKYFIESDMVDDFNNGDQDAFLKKREVLLKREEKLFIQNLDLIYGEEEIGNFNNDYN